MKSFLHTKDGKIIEICQQIKNDGDVLTVSVKKEDFVGINCEYIDFCPDFLVSGIDSCGYAVVPRGTTEGGTMLCNFVKRDDTEYISDSNTMPVFGFKTKENTIFAVVTGMTYEYKCIVGVKDNTYYLYPRFFVSDKMNYEDIEVKYFHLGVGADYNDMATFYRNYKKPISLKERAEKSPELQYGVRSAELRIRMAWKPVPSPIAHQTPDNEPEVVLACDIKKVRRILDGLKKHGIDDVEVCLVGIEKKGHDGRWPQLLPIEEKIGTSEELKELCAYGQKLGFQMVVHTNNTETYQISELWDEDDIIVCENGEYSKDPIFWGGGQPFHICPKQTVKYTKSHLETISGFGFRGLHYIDVFSNFPPRDCFSEKHPSTARESAYVICSIADMTREKMGGFASEGAFDYMADHIDYVLYTSYNLMGVQPKICDETIPFWQLVFHGSILYNPSTETVNYGVKPEKNRLKFIEYGGRPVGYFYSKYVGEGGCGNWMGDEDMTFENDGDLEASLSSFKKMYDDYKALSGLWYELMVSHKKVSDGVYEVTYSNGTKVTVDYNEERYTVSK